MSQDMEVLVRVLLAMRGRDEKCAQNFIIGKTEGKLLFLRRMGRREDNIKIYVIN
jgi:hypothetical protein